MAGFIAAKMFFSCFLGFWCKILPISTKSKTVPKFYCNRVMYNCTFLPTIFQTSIVSHVHLIGVGGRRVHPSEFDPQIM